MALAATIAGLAHAAGGTFTPAGGSPFAVTASPNSIASGDFNGDHNTDLAVPNDGADTVTILLGSRSGSFTNGGDVPVGSAPESAAVADLNADRKDEVVVANTVSDNLSILLGDGHGGFTAAATVPSASAWYVAIGDLNRDKKPDLAVSNLFQNSVSILLGDGTGGFTAASTVPVGTFPYGIAIGDFDHNHKPDLAVANQFAQSVSILLGDGAGGFSATPGSPVTVGSGPSWIATDDLNGDGRDDLAVANQGSDTVSVLLGDGAGGFSPASGSPILVGNCFRPGGACGPTGLVIGDVDGDDTPDLATSNIFSDNVSVLLGNGAGGFTAAAGSPYPVGDGPFSLVLARLDRNGRPDIAAANAFSSNVSVLLNTNAP